MAPLPRTANPDFAPPPPLPRYLASRYDGDGRSLKLKGILLAHGITIADISRAVVQSNGNRLHRSAMSQLVTYGIVPASTPYEAIERQVSKYLAEHGVPADQIATAMQVESSVVALRAHPHSSATGAAHTPRPAPHLTHPAHEIDPTEKVMLTPDAKKHFELFRDPFKDDLQSADDVFLGADQRYCREAMWQCVRSAGFVAVIGESGSGKTVLRHDLMERIGKEHEPTTVITPRLIDKTRLTAGLICQAIIKDIDEHAVIPQSVERQARLVEKLLINASRGGNRHVLIIEESQDLTKQTLKYLKRFHELQDGFRKLLAILLIGQPELKTLLDERTNWDAREVIRRCEIAELQPLHGTAVQAYIEHKLKRAGSDFARVLDATAVDAIKARLTRVTVGKQLDSQLYPLVINNLVTRATNEAAALGVPRINADIIKSLGVR